MQEQVTLIEGGAELLDRVEPLWLELRQQHAALAPIWSEELLASSFEARRKELLSKVSGGMLVLVATANGRDAGYCISTIDASAGEVQSLFVQEKQRSRGIGRQLMSRTMKWFDSRGVQSIGVSVIAGNHDAMKFYSIWDFRPRSVRLLYAKTASGTP